MSARNVWRCIVTGGSGMMLLLSAGAARAQSPQSPKKPDFGLGSAITLGAPLIVSSDQAETVSHESPATPTSTNDTMLWFRKSFVLGPPGGTTPLKPTDGAPSMTKPATAPLAVPAVPVPGTVQNVRRADNG